MKRRSISTRLHCGTSQKTVTFTIHKRTAVSREDGLFNDASSTEQLTAEWEECGLLNMNELVVAYFKVLSPRLTRLNESTKPLIRIASLRAETGRRNLPIRSWSVNHSTKMFSNKFYSL